LTWEQRTHFALPERPGSSLATPRFEKPRLCLLILDMVQIEYTIYMYMEYGPPEMVDVEISSNVEV
jgi:hypothetical protein